MPANEPQTNTYNDSGKKYLNLIVDYMPYNLTKYN